METATGDRFLFEGLAAAVMELDGLTRYTAFETLEEERVEEEEEVEREWLLSAGEGRKTVAAVGALISPFVFIPAEGETLNLKTRGD